MNPQIISNNNLPIMLVGTRDQGQATGISQMFELIIDKFLRNDYPFYIIDLTLGTPTKNAGSLNLLRGIKLLGAISRCYITLPKAKTIYLTVGVSRLGFFRDALLLWPAFLLGKKTIIHVHSGGYGEFYSKQSALIKIIIRQTLSRVDHIIVLGDLLRAQFLFVKNIDRKIEVVKNALTLGLATNINVEKHLETNEPVKILFLSNMIESKGFLDVLEACKILKFDKKVNAHFDFCGGFRSSINDKNQSKVNSIDELRNLITRLDIEDCVNYHGIVSGIDKENLLNNNHILILPTYYSSEGQHACIIEGLAFGLPVIATRFRGIPEEIIDQYNGFFVEPKSPNEIANIIEWLSKHPDEYKELSKNAIKYYTENFTPEVHYQKIMPILLGIKYS